MSYSGATQGLDCEENPIYHKNGLFVPKTR